MNDIEKMPIYAKTALIGNGLNTRISATVTSGIKTMIYRKIRNRKRIKAMKRISHMCINCKYYKSNRCLFDNSYVWNLFCEEPTKCKSWKLSDDYKKGMKFYEEERKKL